MLGKKGTMPDQGLLEVSCRITDWSQRSLCSCCLSIPAASTKAEQCYHVASANRVAKACRAHDWRELFGWRPTRLPAFVFLLPAVLLHAALPDHAKLA